MRRVTICPAVLIEKLRLRWLRLWTFTDRRVAIAFVLGFAGSVAGGLVWYLPKLAVASLAGQATASEIIQRENEARQTWAALAGGLVILVGLYFTWRRVEAAEKQVELAREEQITERFTRAIEQLGSNQLEIRLGGIYGLERIAKDSERDHWPIMEVLTAYVRENARRVDTPAGSPVRTDIQAILTVLARRDWLRELSGDMRLDLSNTDLSHSKMVGACLSRADLRRACLDDSDLSQSLLEDADLSGASLARCDLKQVRATGADLHEACLRESDLSGAILRRADLSFTNLAKAHLFRATLDGAMLTDSNLRGATLGQARLAGCALAGSVLNGAHFFEADLSGASFSVVIEDISPDRITASMDGVGLTGARLAGAELEGVDLTGVIGLTPAQLAEASVDGATKLPEALMRSAGECAQDGKVDSTD